ncbi:MAG: response regulator transcription factor [bacterium]
MKKIRVLVADDHTIVRKGLCALLNSEPNIEVVGEAEDGREAVERIGKIKPDVVLMDISMPSLNGFEATRQIRKGHPGIRILVLTMHTNEEYIFEILQAGASGYVLKKSAPSDLVSAINAVYQGSAFLSPPVAEKVIERLKGMTVDNETKKVKLTEREREVLQLIAEGCTNKEIAKRLFISVKTVESHRTHLMEKLDIHHASGLTKYAIQKRIIQPDGC